MSEFDPYEVHVAEIDGDDDAMVVRADLYERLLQAYEAARAEVLEVERDLEFWRQHAKDREAEVVELQNLIALLRTDKNGRQASHIESRAGSMVSVAFLDKESK